MRVYLFRRLVSLVPLLAVVFVAVFCLVHLIPGDPVDFLVGENAELDRRAELRQSFHLDKPLLFNSRPWLGQDEVLPLLETAGAWTLGQVGTVAEEEARMSIGDLGRFAVVPLIEIWGDVEQGHSTREAARKALARAARVPGPKGEQRNLQLEQLLAYDEPGIGAEALVLAWVEAHPAAFRPQMRQRVAVALADTQFGHFLGDLLQGEFVSLHRRIPVTTIVAHSFRQTLKLACAALLVSLLVALPLGTLAAWKQGSWVDHLSMLGALLGVSMPNFWLGPLLILAFSVELGWFPVSGAERPGSLVLPAATLGLGMSAILCRITRTSVLEVLSEDFIRTARAKGLSARVTLVRHGLRAALIPIVTILGLQFGALLAGSIITEEIFGWPGLGRELLQAIRSRDFPVLQGCVLGIATTYLLVNVFTDALTARIDPRVRLDR